MESTIKVYKILLGFFILITLISFSSAITYVDKCMDLTIAGEYYQQNASIKNNSVGEYGNCIIIKNSSITFDGNGYNISAKDDATATMGNIIYTNQNNTTIKNIKITNITSTTIIEVFSGINIMNNNNTIISNVNIEDNTNIFNTKINGQNINNLLINNSNFWNGYTSIYLINSNNTIVTDTNLIKSIKAFEMNSLNPSIVSAVNVTYTGTEDISFNNKITRKWYFNAQANSTLNNLPIANVNVSARDNTNALIFSVLTNSNGYIPTQELTEYVNNGGTRTYYSNYTINATRGLVTQSSSLNLTDNSFVQFLFSRRPQFQIADGKLALFDGKLILSS